MKTVVIDYGAGNVFSVVMALKRLGVEAVVSDDAEIIRTASRVIFPGVGQASAAMKHLKATGLDHLIPQLRMPVLGICLGMQLMCCATEEDHTPGLGIFPLNVKQFTGDFKIPHMGWNTIGELKSGLFHGIGKNPWMYFVHSYYVPVNEYCVADCDYHGQFAAAVQKDNFYGCQFHPEKSSLAGEQIMRNFLELG